MNKPCDICLEETCNGKHDCHCETCKIASQCYRKLHPTIRITNKCTQQCSHCCFSSSPASNIMMSVQQSEKTAQFLKNNHIESVNLMGGEFFCNPDWFEIISNIAKVVKFVRLVTNGDWAKNEKVKEKLSELISTYGKTIRFSISKDQWHTNKHVEEAAQFFEEQGASYNVATPEETKTDCIVPVGRSQLACAGGFYSMFGCFCHNPKEMYSFLIDEEGLIYKCGFGILQYAIIDNFLNGGFNERFKYFNKEFYKIFISSCQTCARFFVCENGKNGRQLVVKTE